MNIKVGSKVKIARVIESTDKHLYKSKKSYIGKEGVIYGTPHKFYGSRQNGLPERMDGKIIYSVKDANGKDVSMYAWFAEELQLIE